MKVIAINGSPRKKWNTAALLEKALEGATSQGAETELLHLYDLDFKGCMACYACKTKDGPSYGRCASKDDLTPVLRKVPEADALVLGSPIYFGTVTGEMRSFMERLLFPYFTYTDPPGSIFPRKISTGFIHTMGAPEEVAKERNLRHINSNTMNLKLIFGASESLCSYDTYEIEDYGKIVATRFDPEKKAKRRAEVFPIDCEKAFQMGARFAKRLA